MVYAVNQKQSFLANTRHQCFACCSQRICQISFILVQCIECSSTFSLRPKKLEMLKAWNNKDVPIYLSHARENIQNCIQSPSQPCLGSSRKAPPHKRLLSFEPHSFPSYDQLELGSHIQKLFALLRNGQSQRVSYLCNLYVCRILSRRLPLHHLYHRAEFRVTSGTFSIVCSTKFEIACVKSRKTIKKMAENVAISIAPWIFIISYSTLIA